MYISISQNIFSFNIFSMIYFFPYLLFIFVTFLQAKVFIWTSVAYLSLNRYLKLHSSTVVFLLICKSCLIQRKARFCYPSVITLHCLYIISLTLAISFAGGNPWLLHVFISVYKFILMFVIYLVDCLILSHSRQPSDTKDGQSIQEKFVIHTAIINN